MAKAIKGIYNRRHPERPVPECFYQGTDYYSPIEAFEDRRIIESSFEEFERSYPDRFERFDVESVGAICGLLVFITDCQTKKRILKHIEEETIRPPPLSVKTPTANIHDTVFWDSTPSAGSYFNDTGYIN